MRNSDFAGAFRLIADKIRGIHCAVYSGAKCGRIERCVGAQGPWKVR